MRWSCTAVGEAAARLAPDGVERHGRIGAGRGRDAGDLRGMEVDEFDGALQQLCRWPGIAALTRSEKGAVIARGQEMHVLNAVSPGFTCAIPFADYVVARIEERLEVGGGGVHMPKAARC